MCYSNNPGSFVPVNQNNQVNFPNIPLPVTQSQYRIKQKIHFTIEEDIKLTKLVKIFSDKNFAEIAKNMPGRTQYQCKYRWKNYLSPDVNNNPWTQEEDKLLMTKYKELGPKWVEIARFLNGRTNYNVRNRFSILENRINRTSIIPQQTSNKNTEQIPQNLPETPKQTQENLENSSIDFNDCLNSFAEQTNYGNDFNFNGDLFY